MSEELFSSDEIVSVNQHIRNLKDADGRKIQLIGITAGKKCKDCVSFYYVQYAKVYRRCEFYPKKNWKSNMEACGQFKVKNDPRK